MASWTPNGFVGRLAAAIVGYMPRPSVELPPPTFWGLEEVVRERLEGYAEEVTVERRSLSFARDSMDELLAFHERCNGPMVAARALLRDRYAPLREDVRQLMDEFNARNDGGVEIHSDYLLVTARA